MGSIPITRSILPKMLPLYQARDRIEAQILHDFLDRHLIETVILRDSLSGAVGELPADIYPTLWLIYDEDLERGRELLERFLGQLRACELDPPWTCPSCGESLGGAFDICWNCGRSRPTES